VIECVARILIGCADAGINNGGADMAQALGVRLSGAEGREMGAGGGELAPHWPGSTSPASTHGWRACASTPPSTGAPCCWGPGASPACSTRSRARRLARGRWTLASPTARFEAGTMAHDPGDADKAAAVIAARCDGIAPVVA